MKNIPLLVCALVGIVFLPWNLILPQNMPYPDDEIGDNGLVQYLRKEQAKKGVTDPRSNEQITRETLVAFADKNPGLLDQYPDFGRQYQNLKYVNRRPGYFTATLNNLYGDREFQWRLAWVVPAGLALLYLILISAGLKRSA